MYEAISKCSDLNPDEDSEGDDGEYDYEDGPAGRIIFEGDGGDGGDGGSDPAVIEGFSGVFAGARDGGLPPAMPGSGGWITAENVHEFFDEEGNWIGGEGEEVEEGGVSGELGGGAGAVHPRGEEEEAAEREGRVNGDGDGSKRVRTE